MTQLLHVEGNNDTAGPDTPGAAESEEITIWMKQHQLPLSDDSYAKLKVNGFDTIKDFQIYQSANELYDGAKDMGLIIKDAQMLKRAFDKFDFITPGNTTSGNTTNDNDEKKHWVDTEENSIINSMEIQLEKLKNIINNLKSKETKINEEKLKIEQEIQHTFNDLIVGINNRQQQLYNELNNLTDNKNALLKTQMVKYENSSEVVNNIKLETEKLMNTKMHFTEVEQRKLKVIENGKTITGIINDLNNKEDIIEINETVFFSLDSYLYKQFLDFDEFGCISEVNIPILKELNNNNDTINVLWECDKSNFKHSKRELIIKYKNIEMKDYYKWETIKFDIDKNINGIQHIQINTSGTYIFKLKCYLCDNKLYSAYSNIKSIKIENINQIDDEKDEKKNDNIGDNNFKNKVINALSFNERNSLYRWYLNSKGIDEICKISIDEQFISFIDKTQVMIRIQGDDINVQDLFNKISIKPKFNNDNDIISHISTLKLYAKIEDEQSTSQFQWFYQTNKKPQKTVNSEQRIVHIKKSKIMQILPVIFTQTITKLNRLHQDEIERLKLQLEKQIENNEIDGLTEFKLYIETATCVGLVMIKFVADYNDNNYLNVGCKVQLSKYSISDNIYHIKQDITDDVQTTLKAEMEKRFGK